MVNCAVYRFHNIPMKTELHGEDMKSSDVHSTVEVLGLACLGCWLLVKCAVYDFFLNQL